MVPCTSYFERGGKLRLSVGIGPGKGKKVTGGFATKKKKKKKKKVKNLPNGCSKKRKKFAYLKKVGREWCVYSTPLI